MSTLAERQREFIGLLYAEEPVAGRLAIYRRNMLANLHDALAQTYPVVARLVGPAFFREAARRFALAHPSASGDLNLYGARFAQFLGDYPHARHLAYLADVARLEWACHECFHGADGTRLEIDALARVPADRHGAIRFGLHPAVRLVGSAHAVLAIWEANQDDRDGTPERLEGPDRVLVRREGLAVRLRALDAPDWAFLGALARGATLEQCLEALPEDAAPDHLALALRRFSSEGVIAGFALDEGDA